MSKYESVRIQACKHTHAHALAYLPLVTSPVTAGVFNSRVGLNIGVTPKAVCHIQVSDFFQSVCKDTLFK